MGMWDILIRLCVGLLLCAALLVAAGCSRLPTRPDAAPVLAVPAAQGTILDEKLAHALASHPGESGFRLVPSGSEAFAWRGETAHLAGRSLDVQYYIWHDDLTGRLLVSQLLAAADRGVRVRMLLDDMDARAHNFALAALAAHPMISVRLFNPFASREGMFGKMMEGITSFSRINHRMHNKVWIADNRIAIAGGRNIGDEYFTASDEVNFQDMDLVVAGPAVQQLSDSFDRYWNSSAVWPVQTLSPKEVNQPALDKLRTNDKIFRDQAMGNAWLKAFASSNMLRQLEASNLPMQWTPQWQVLSDDPAKAQKGDSPMERSNVLRGLTAELSGAKSRIELISPYFVPGKQATALFTNAAASGREVEILTNSLAANDVAAVHSGYAKYREDLLRGGVKLWELKPESSRAKSMSLLGSSGASLHTKAAVIDSSTIFVGSFNLDPRSVSLNCEQGILVDNPNLAVELHQLFLGMTSPASAWQVKENAKGKLEWTDGTQTFDKEPMTSWSKRAMATVMGWLPIQAQL